MMNSRCMLASSALIGSLIFASAHAQGLPTRAATGPEAVAGLPQGVRFVPPPPTNFDPTAASAAERAQYNIPPAPDRIRHPDEYQVWLRGVGGQSIHESPTLNRTNIFNRPAIIVGASAPSNISNSVVKSNSTNWSGSAVTGFTNPVNQEAIIQEFVVPTARQAFGACTGTWDYSSVWPGIDGWGSNDVLQGGIEADAYCNGSTQSTFYSAWIEWYPLSSVRVSSPAISPGDLLFVEVWNTSATSGFVYFHDYSTNVTAEYQLTAPNGTTLQGNSVEWIVERPGVSGGLATLTNYIDVTSTRGIAWDYTASSPTIYYPHANPSVGTLNQIVMLDNNGNGISAASGWNSQTLWFLNFGSSCGLGNTAGNPC